MEWIKKGKAWVVGDNVVPDAAIGWNSTMDALSPDELAKFFMVKIDPEIPKKVKKGDLLVAGRNFGYVRAHGAFWGSLRGAGIAGIIAESFAPPFFRACIGDSLPIIECKDITKKVNQGDELEVNFKTGAIKNLTTAKSIEAEPLPDYQIQVMEAGGYKAYLKKKIAAERMKR